MRLKGCGCSSVDRSGNRGWSTGSRRTAVARRPGAACGDRLVAPRDHRVSHVGFEVNGLGANIASG